MNLSRYLGPFSTLLITAAFIYLALDAVAVDVGLSQKGVSVITLLTSVVITGLVNYKTTIFDKRNDPSQTK